MVVVSPAFTETLAGSKAKTGMAPAGADGAGAGAVAGGAPGICAPGGAAGAPTPGAPAGGVAEIPAAGLAPAAGTGGVMTTDSSRISGFVSVPEAMPRRFSAVI